MEPNEQLPDRDYGSAPFRPGEIDVEALKSTLKRKRKIDSLMLQFLDPGHSEILRLTEDQAVRAFNALIDSDLYLHVDPDYLKLRPAIERLLAVACESRRNQQRVDHDVERTLNRALLHAIYPEELVKCRQYDRFTAPEFMRRSVTISPLSQAMSESYEGKLLNISLGGMALLLPVRLPELTYWALRVSLGDHTEIETLVQIRHSVAQQDQFAHGFQFVNIPSYLSEQLQQMKQQSRAA